MAHEHHEHHSHCDHCEHHDAEHIHVCDCGHEHCHGEHEQSPALKWTLLGISAALLAASFLPLNRYVLLGFAVVSVLLSGFDLFFDAVKDLFRLEFDESVLMLISVVAAFILGEYSEAAAVALFFRLGEELEDYASDRSRRSIEALSEMKADHANRRKADGSVETVSADAVNIGDTLVVYPHERIPVDGTVIDGSSTVNCAALTGESLPVEAGAGFTALSGMINGSGTLEMTVTAAHEDSYASRVIEMVEHAASRKGDTQRLITKLAKIYTPIVAIGGLLLAIIPSLITGDWNTWIYRGLVFWVASCPCALVLSIPLCFFAAIGTAASHGILIKGAKFIEAAAAADTVAFDKTGTLTADVLEVTALYPVNGYSEEGVTALLAAAETLSSHPIARAIQAAYGTVDPAMLSDFCEFPGGTSVRYDGHILLCGGKTAMAKHGIAIDALPPVPVCLVVDGVLAAGVTVDSPILPDAPQVVAKLKAAGVRHTALLTGDNAARAEAAAAQCGIEQIRAELLPEDKLHEMETLRQNGKVIYVGDGINDAPVLAASDVGIAVGLGTDAAREAADVVLTGGIRRLPLFKTLCRRAVITSKVNITFILLVKAVVLLLGALGFAPVWLAVFADVGVLLIALLISLTVRRVKAEGDVA